MKLSVSHWFVLLCSCALFVIGVMFHAGRTGFYLGVAVSIIVLASSAFGQSLSRALLLVILGLNLIIITVNTFGPESAAIRPLFGDSTSAMFDKSIARYVTIFGSEYAVRRRTGISDNIHLSSLLLLLLIAYATARRSMWVARFTSVMLVVGANIQYILIWLLWLYLHRDHRQRLPIIPIAVIFLGGFFAADYLLLDGSYSYLLGTLGVPLASSMLGYYIQVVPPAEILFGLPPGGLDQLLGNFSYVLPIEDIGLIGIPIQFGLAGVLLMVAWLRLVWKYARKNERVLIGALLLSIVHYFNLASLLGTISLGLLVKTMGYDAQDHKKSKGKDAPNRGQPPATALPGAN